MLHWFRRRAAAITVVVFALLGSLGGSSLRPHADDCHGSGCGTVSAPHDPSMHSVGTPSAPDDHPFHCVVCHLVRALRPATDVVYHLAPSRDRAVRLHLAFVAAPPAYPAAQPPLRSPPAPAPFI